MAVTAAWRAVRRWKMRSSQNRDWCRRNNITASIGRRDIIAPRKVTLTALRLAVRKTANSGQLKHIDLTYF
ncbi:hypothetical protein PanWU01x14_038640 [Parasponia andersonii]|uniref:Uncharacterized protein n=1 Tax=Parasponia andersonii TaxID=3476 RepID=A0A2P5DRJ4_PARAD|nr:hypothetical protein PanWU01x14_038640 [Parasponia andersonii]